MVIGIISAMDEEIKKTVASIQDCKKTLYKDNTFYEGYINQNKIVVLKCGVGKVNAAIGTTLLITKYDLDLIINSGIAGGGLGVNTKDLLIAEKFSYSDVDCVHFGYEFGVVPGMNKYFETDLRYRNKLKDILNKLKICYKEGEILTADTFRMSKKELRNEINGNYGVEMEGAAIAQTCYRLNVPFLSIRIISDLLDSDNHIEEYSKFEAHAAELSSKLTIDFIKEL